MQLHQLKHYSKKKHKQKNSKRKRPRNCWSIWYSAVTKVNTLNSYDDAESDKRKFHSTTQHSSA